MGSATCVEYTPHTTGTILAVPFVQNQTTTYYIDRDPHNIMYWQVGVVLLMLVPTVVAAHNWTTHDCQTSNTIHEELLCWRDMFGIISSHDDIIVIAPNVTLQIPESWTISPRYHHTFGDAFITHIHPDITDDTIPIGVRITETTLRGQTLVDHLHGALLLLKPLIQWTHLFTGITTGDVDTAWITLNGYPGYAISYDMYRTGWSNLTDYSFLHDGMVYTISFSDTHMPSEYNAQLSLIKESLNVTYHGIMPGYDPPVDMASVASDIRYGIVTRIVDGDTIDIDYERYRLALVSAPDRGEAGFHEATDFVKGLCPVGSTAYYMIDTGQPVDIYGRHIAEVWCDDISIQEALLQSGHGTFTERYCDTTHLSSQWVSCVR